MLRQISLRMFKLSEEKARKLALLLEKGAKKLQR
jgi:hypothetical protein